MLKFGIRQAGGCGRRPKNAKPTTKPNVQTQKKSPEAPRGPPEAPRGPRRRPERPAGRPPEASKAPQNPEVHRAKTRPEAPRKPPRGPGGHPDGFRSSEGHDRKSPQPFRKILKRYRSARDKTLDQSQADKGGEWEFRASARNPKRYKVGWMPCVSRGVGKRNQHTSSWFVAHERCAVA